MDFGLARSWGKRSTLRLTGKGTVLGTPEYVSPEQCMGEPLDQRTDVYSLGAVCFEVFTGDVPFSGPRIEETLVSQVADPLPLDRPEVRRLPDPLLQMLCRSLEKRPEDRYRTVEEMITALEHSRREHAAASAERRRHSRLEFPVSCRITVTGPEGQLLRGESTIADNISRGGVRVRTAMTTLRAGDRVTFDEADGSFRTQSEVRACRLAADNVHRLHLRFVEHEAPQHLVGTC